MIRDLDGAAETRAGWQGWQKTGANPDGTWDSWTFSNRVSDGTAFNCHYHSDHTPDALNEGVWDSYQGTVGGASRSVHEVVEGAFITRDVTTTDGAGFTTTPSTVPSNRQGPDGSIISSTTSPDGSVEVSTVTWDSEGNGTDHSTHTAADGTVLSDTTINVEVNHNGLPDFILEDVWRQYVTALN